MRSCILSERSQLLTRDGWLAVGVEGRQFEVAGVDRFGKVTFQEVENKKTAASEKSVFLGTSRSCGIFSAATWIQDSTGRSTMVGIIVEKMLIGEMRFEQVLHAGSSASGQDKVAPLWSALCSEAAFSDESELAIRCKGTPGPLLRPEIGRVMKRNGRSYLILRRSDFERAVLSLGRHCALDSISAAFLDEDDLFQFARSSISLVMEMARALTLQGTSYQLIYDSLQHSSLLLMRIATSDSSPLGKGACGHFVAGETYSEIQLSWESNSWNPVCNGVVLSTQRDANA